MSGDLYGNQEEIEIDTVLVELQREEVQMVMVVVWLWGEVGIVRCLYDYWGGWDCQVFV